MAKEAGRNNIIGAQTCSGIGPDRQTDNRDGLQAEKLQLRLRIFNVFSSALRRLIDDTSEEGLSIETVCGEEQSQITADDDFYELYVSSSASRRLIDDASEEGLSIETGCGEQQPRSSTLQESPLQLQGD